MTEFGPELGPVIAPRVEHLLHHRIVRYQHFFVSCPDAARVRASGYLLCLGSGISQVGAASIA